MNQSKFSKFAIFNLLYLASDKPGIKTRIFVFFFSSLLYLLIFFFVLGIGKEKKMGPFIHRRELIHPRMIMIIATHQKCIVPKCRQVANKLTKKCDAHVAYAKCSKCEMYDVFVTRDNICRACTAATYRLIL